MKVFLVLGTVESLLIGAGALRAPAASASRRDLQLGATVVDAEEAVLNIMGENGRVSLQAEEESRLAVLLDALKVEKPATMDELQGEWQLLYTTKSKFDAKNPLGRRVDGTAPGVEAVFDTVFSSDQPPPPSSSPIQRALTSIESIRIEQNILLTEPSSSGDNRVDQLVRISDDISLRLSADATFNATTGRIDFTFDLAYFDLFGLRIPYPVPFRLLGDEAKGWLDTLYVSNRLRISRGNKGTTFILGRPRTR